MIDHEHTHNQPSASHSITRMDDDDEWQIETYLQRSMSGPHRYAVQLTPSGT